MALPASNYMSPDEYLVWESTQFEKNEYVDGEIYAMVGATRMHVTVAGNMFNLLSAFVDSTPCRAYISDMKLRVDEVNAYFYPDILVTCDSSDHQADVAMSAPILIVEVLSPSTSGYDRGDKFAAYRKIPSLREYVLIDPDRKSVECFRLGSDGHWVLFDFSAEERVRLDSIAFETTVTSIFKNVD